MNERDLMILSVAHFARKMAKRYVRPHLPFEDLVQEAMLGACMAADRYDPARGLKFMTYARWWMHQRLSAYYYGNHSMASPRSTKVKGLTTDEGVEGLYTVVDPSPSPEMIVLEADWDRKAEASLALALRLLPEKYRDVVLLRWLREETRKAIGSRFGVSAQRVHQIELAAITRLRASIDSELLERV